MGARCCIGLSVLWGLSACSAADYSGAMGAGEPCNIVTGPLTGSPSMIDRDDPVQIEVIWQLELGDVFAPAIAVLALDAGDGSWGIEVDLPLSYDGDVWRGQLLNPFGMGAPAGDVEVLATGQKYPDCPIAPSATTSLVVR